MKPSAVASVSATQDLQRSRTESQNSYLYVLAIAGAITVIHLLTNGRYGFHRDELQVLSDARHMDWGFVAYPPLTPAIERISLAVFGVSLIGLRLASVLAQGLAIIITGLAAREFGGGRIAQFTAALAVALSPLPLFNGTEFQYTSFDFLWWVLISYFVIRLLRTEEPRWWLAIGAAAGLGLMTKYSILFFIAGLSVGLLVTSARRFLASGWFWAGAGLALLICLPNFVWQLRHNLISLDFLHHIHARDVAQGRTAGFLPGQLLICTTPVSALLWIPGLICYFRSKRFRLLAWMYVVPLLLFLIAKGRDYYLAGAYPMLIAMGATAAEGWVAVLRPGWSQAVKTAFFAALAIYGAYVCAVILPLAPSGPLRDFALRNNGDLREEFGWNELVRTVAQIRNGLPPQEQQHAGILVGNYGEQGAIEILGAAYNVPPIISGTNSAWLRGYPLPPPSTLIVVGLSHTYVERTFTSCQVAGRNGNNAGVENEESRDHPDIFVCGPPRLPWPEFWKSFQHFG